MPIGHQLALGGESLHRLALPARLVVGDILEDSRLEHKEPAIDPALADLGFLGELEDPVPLEDQAAKPRWRPYSRSCRQLAVSAMELDEAFTSTFETPSP